jgi:hypothetical protein
VYALASNYTGLGMNDTVGDGVVDPRSSVAGAPHFSATQCPLVSPPWNHQPRHFHANGCWHVDQPVNQNLVALALAKLRDDITQREQANRFLATIAGHWDGGSRSLDIDKSGLVRYAIYVPCYQYEDSCLGSGEHPNTITIDVQLTTAAGGSASGAVRSVTPTGFARTLIPIPQVGQSLTLKSNDQSDRLYMSDYSETAFCRTPTQTAGSYAYC